MNEPAPLSAPKRKRRWPWIGGAAAALLGVAATCLTRGALPFVPDRMTAVLAEDGGGLFAARRHYALDNPAAMAWFARRLAWAWRSSLPCKCGPWGRLTFAAGDRDAAFDVYNAHGRFMLAHDLATGRYWRLPATWDAFRARLERNAATITDEPPPAAGE